MKVLVISHNPFSKTSNNGRTLESIFSEFPNDSILQMFFLENESPDFDFNAKYFKISDREIIKRFCLIGKKPGEQVYRWSNNPSLINKRGQNAYNFRSFLLSVRDFIWEVVPNKLELAFNWLDKEKPDIIFFVGGDSVFSHRIARKVSKKLNVPLVVYFTDDYVLNARGNNFVDRARINYLKKDFKKTVNASSSLFVIGKSMERAYSSFFRRKFSSIMNCVDLIPQKNYFLDMKEITISYFGGLHLNRDMMIVRFGKILSEIAVENYLNINFRVFTALPSDNVLTLFMENGINYCGFVDADNILAEMQRSSFLLHVESDLSYYKSLTKLSVSTKIPEYLISSIPILAFGPTDVASIELLQENNIGNVVDCLATDYEVKNQLLDLFENEGIIQEKVKMAYLYAKSNFDKKENSSKLYNSLKQIVNENK